MSLFLNRLTGKSDALNILTICTGNICRSPLAEAILQVALGELPVVIRSAGTRVVYGQRPPSQTLAIAEQLELTSINNHRSRPLLVADIERANLVLAMDYTHRRKVVEAMPKAGKYTFTVREFARLVFNMPIVTLGITANKSTSSVVLMRKTIMAYSEMRGTVSPPDNLTELDVVDPFGKPDEFYVRTANEIIQAVGVIAGMLHQVYALSERGS